MNNRVFSIATAVAGLATAGAVAVLPQAMLDLLVWRLWLPHLASAATPPVGVTGRVVFALIAGSCVAAIGVLPLLVARFARGRARQADDMPVLRRADAHPDAPARRPIRASADLGEPLPIAAAPLADPLPEPERPLPADLDQPLAAFDPTAVPAAPLEPMRALAPLAPRPSLIDPGERFETFVLTPVVRAAAPAMVPEAVVEGGEVAPADAPPLVGSSIGSLLERLERATPRRSVSPSPTPSNLDETLGMLRRLAAG